MGSVEFLWIVLYALDSRVCAGWNIVEKLENLVICAVNLKNATPKL